MSKEKLEEFEKLAKPLIKYLNDNHNPHTSIRITTTSAEVVQGLMAFSTTEFVGD